MKHVFAMLIVATMIMSLPSCKKSKCDGVYCLNGGTCNPTTGQCMCVLGFTGTDCSVAIPDCELNNTSRLIITNYHASEYVVRITGLNAYYLAGGQSYNADVPVSSSVTVTATLIDGTDPHVSHWNLTHQCYEAYWHF